VLNLDKLKEHLSKFVVLFPGDHTSQFYPGQIIYETLRKYIANITSKTSVPHEELLSLVSLIGPLHIDLNADEDLVLNYHPFAKSLYESLFKQNSGTEAKALEDKIHPRNNIWWMDSN
jgi:hypothetical protein